MLTDPSETNATAKALDLMTTDRNFWRSAFEDCAADGFSAAEQAIAQRIAAISEECDALRDRLAWSERERGRCQAATNAMGRILRDFLGGDDYKEGGQLMKPDAATMEAEAKELEAEIAALRAKAAAFDVLAAAVAREDSSDWEIYHGIENPVVIYMRATGRVISAETLADAVCLAMDAEGER